MNKRTKALQIPKTVKEAVAVRDSVDGCPCCVICGRPGNPDAHFIPRSQGGLGIAKNIVTLCMDCHRMYDQSPHRGIYKAMIQAHLLEKYPGWREEDLYYRRTIQ